MSTGQRLMMSKNVSPSALEEAALFMSRLRANMLDIPKDDLPVIIDLLATTSTAVKNALNSYSPINNLPDEILALIFALVPNERRDYETDWFDSPVLVTTDILPLTHVCRHWREVALSNQFLWTSITLAEETVPMGALFLERAGSSLLTYNVQISPDAEEDFWISLLEHHSSRIRRLQVARLPLHFATTFGALARSAMPELVECIVRVQSALSSTDTSGLREFCLLGGHAPRLQRLTLLGIGGFPVDQFDTLTHLSLYSSRGEMTNGGDMVKFLRRCPNLQHLIVEARHFQKAPQPVSLARLRTLMVNYIGSPTNVSRILSTIAHPPDVAVVMADIGKWDWYSMYLVEAIRMFGLVLNTTDRLYFNIISDPPIPKMSMVAVTDHSIISIVDMYFHFSPNDAEQPYIPSSSVNELWIRVESGSDYSIMHALGQMFSSVETLVLCFDPPGRLSFTKQETDWSKTIETLDFPIHPRVSCMRICTWYGFIPAMITGGLAARAETGTRVAHLIIELPLWGEARFTISDLERYADTVEVVKTSGCTLMDVPEVYKNQPHRFWPKWPDMSCIPWDRPPSWAH